jgi:7,8-dihydropterin-6-yl-methyl-4-(beta-D-ribofuranosyl)aminobenzene 5'-phosphate synthase
MMSEGIHIFKTSSLIFTALLVCCSLLGRSHAQDRALGKGVAPKTPGDNIRITVLYDNNPGRAGLEVGWGFSCILRGSAKTILFDTGGVGLVLLRNMEKLGISPGEVDIVVLSHVHGDHVGGLTTLLARNSNVSVYVPLSFPKWIKEEITAHGAGVVDVGAPLMVCAGVYSTGELSGPVREQGLIVETAKGGILITGCAHPGIVKMAKKAKDLIRGDLFLVVGGFHLGGTGLREIEEIARELRDLGIVYVGPCHCSGSTARRVFKRVYRKGYLNVGVGSVIDLKDLSS